MRTTRHPWLLATALIVALAASRAGRAADAPRFSAEQLDQIVAPVALYPDSLLTQVFIAATYPLEIVEADRWRKQNASLTGDALAKALEEKDWDASVDWLCSFPDVLDRMSTNLDWTQDMGDAFLDQQSDVMDAVQRMRAKAEAAGTLKTDKQQVVVKEKETIVIQPADPQTVYVPTYPPTVYGPTYAAPPYYPAVYPPTATWGGTLLTFGAGMATGALISNAFDWDDHDVYVHGYNGGGGHGNQNVNVNKNVNINNANIQGNRQKWQHNPEHRRGVDYKNPSDQRRYGERDRQASRDRAQNGRGYGDQGRPAGAGRPDGPGAGNRPERPGGGGAGRPDRPGGGGAGRPPSAATRPGGPGGGGDRPGGGRPESRPAAGRPTPKNDAFGNYGNGHATREASNRGAASRNKPSYAGGGGGGRPSSGGSGGRGGGGGGRGGGGGGGGRGGGGGGRGGGRGR